VSSIGKKDIKRIAIANRGEVAVRIIRACEDLGLETLLLHSEVDIGSRAYRLATKKICIGGAPVSESYLNIQANIDGALAGGAHAIHPGFGFLSENADFAQAVVKAGMVFIGPSAASIRLLGDKVSCKGLARRASVPLVPGYEGEDQGIDRLIQEAKKIGFPVIAKAAAGGGGRGMKLLTGELGARELLESAKRESLSAFGSDKVFLEKYLDHAKHIEFQIFADSTGRVIHLGDRECSVQRRHQKIIEEANSVSLTEELRKKMGEDAVRLVQAGNYQGAGTVEFLLQDGEYYFLEVNTRLQVEHPVTEEVMGIDLVKAQILTAMGQFGFSSTQKYVAQGHSIECRIYAENPYMGGMPSTGKLGLVQFPEGPGRRFEYGFEEGDTITSFYDPMIAKVIVWDETRGRCIQKMTEVLKRAIIFGVMTNIPYLIEILNHPEFVDGTMTTRFIEKYFSQNFKEPVMGESEEELLKELRVQVLGSRDFNLASQSSNMNSPWMQSWRNI